MRTRIRYYHWLVMRSRIHLILVSHQAHLFSLSSIVQRLQANFYFLMFQRLAVITIEKPTNGSNFAFLSLGRISDRRTSFVRSGAILCPCRRLPVTGLLLTVFLIGAFSSNRSTGLAHVPCFTVSGSSLPDKTFVSSLSDQFKLQAKVSSSCWVADTASGQNLLSFLFLRRRMFSAVSSLTIQNF